MAGPPAGYSLNRPNAIRTAQNKYGPNSPIAPFLQSAPPSVQRALMNYDRSRVNLGQSPISNRQTVRAGKSLGTLQIRPIGPVSTVHADATTAAPDRPWWQDAVSDVQQILSAVPKVPGLLAEEAAQAPHLSERIDEALSKAQPGASPFETLGNLAQVPFVRLVPGAFTASQFGTGGAGVGGLTEHPLMSVLDVLPYAEKGASLAPSAKLAKETATRAAEIGGYLPERTTPLSSLFKYGRPGGAVVEDMPRFGEFGQVVPTMQPNPVYGALSRIPKLLGHRGIGGYAESAFGDAAREQARIQNRLSSGMEQMVNNPEFTSLGLDTPAAHIGARAAQAGNELGNTFRDLSVEDRVAASNALRSDADLTTLSPRQQEYIAAYRESEGMYTHDLMNNTDKVSEVEFPHGPEIYDMKTQGKITSARHLEAQQMAAANLRDTLNPHTATSMTPHEIVADLERAMTDPAVGGKKATALARGYLTALAGQGIDVTAATSSLLKRNNRATRAGLSDLIDLSRGQRVPVPTATVESFADALEPLASKSTVVNRFVTNIKRDNLEEAMVDARQLAGNRAAGDLLSQAGLDLSQIREVVANRKAVIKADKRLSAVGYKKSGMKQAADARASIERTSVPARYQYAIEDAAIPKMVDAVNRASAQGRFDAAATEQLITQITNRMFPQASETFPELLEIQSQIRDSWQKLAEEGLNPTFVHNVTPEGAQAVQYPRVADHITSPGQFKARLWSGGSKAQPLEVALSHQGMDLLNSEGNQAFVDQLIDAFALPAADIRARFLAEAEAAHTANPAINMEAHLEQLINKAGFQGWDPRSFVTGKPSNRTPYYLPRSVAKNLDRIRATPSDLAQAVSAPMNLFRTSVLPLSPRWHVNNILGGLITTTARSENPLLLWSPSRIKRAWQMARDGGPDSILADSSLTREERAMAELNAPGGATRQNTEWMRDTKLKTSTDKLTFLNDYSAARTMRRLADQGRESRVGGMAAGGIQASYNFNQLFDDFYRSAAYLEGSDRALAKGMSRVEQIRAGVQATRDVLQNWDTLTPIERSTMRMVFPFYSWTRFMLKYVLTYPGDHPWRTEILSALSRTEGHDYGSGLPRDLQTLFFLGQPDKDGKISAINTAGFNPFRDTANYATLAGFLAGGGGDISAVTSQVNPLIGTTLEWAGIDPSSGMADMYPEMQYDPNTGRLIATPKSNPLFQAAGNFLPQLNAVTAFAGINSEYRAIAARDPQAAGRYLASTMGVPVLRRDVDLNREIIGGEVTRYNQQRTALNSGLASGDMSAFARQYPGMRALVDRIDVLSQRPDFIQKYGIVRNQRGSYQPSIWNSLAEAGKTAL